MQRAPTERGNMYTWSVKAVSNTPTYFTIGVDMNADAHVRLHAFHLNNLRVSWLRLV